MCTEASLRERPRTPTCLLCVSAISQTGGSFVNHVVVEAPPPDSVVVEAPPRWASASSQSNSPRVRRIPRPPRTLRRPAPRDGDIVPALVRRRRRRNTPLGAPLIAAARPGYDRTRTCVRRTTHVGRSINPNRYKGTRKDHKMLQSCCKQQLRRHDTCALQRSPDANMAQEPAKEEIDAELSY